MTYSNHAAYERFMGRWSALLAPRFIQFAGVRDGLRILDVGCGTGSLSRALLASGRSITVVGVDPTEDYVAFARQTIPDPRVSFRVSSVESLPFPDGSLDAAMALLVLQEMADPEGAVREMPRATRLGGPVAACLWDFQSGLPMFSLFWQAAEAVAPDAVARRRAERPPSQLGLQRLAEIWTGAGLAEVTTGSLELTQEFGSFEDFWLPFLDRSTPVTEFAIAVNRETGGGLASELRRIIPRARSDGSFALPARALAVVGIVGH